MLAMTLLVRNEIDIIAHWVSYHLPKVDMLIVTDNGSIDGTREFLENHKKDIIIIDEPAHNFAQDKWVDRMIHTAKSKGAKWIINSDADEFWIGDFKEVIDKYKDDYNTLRVPSFVYVPTDRDDESEPNPLYRMNHRLIRPRNAQEAMCFGSWNKMIHTVNGFDKIELGNHQVHFKKGVERNIKNVEERDLYIRHYCERSFDHYRRKYIQGGEAYKLSPLPANYGFHWRDKYQVYYTTGIEGLRELYKKDTFVSSNLVSAITKFHPIKDKTSSKFSIFYHVAVMAVWNKIVEEQMDALRANGLIDANMTVGIVSDSETNLYCGGKNTKTINVGKVNDYEFPTLKLLWDHCRQNPDDRVLYFHTKGASKNIMNGPTGHWRAYLMEYMIGNWKRCLRDLDNYDVTCVEWTEGSDLIRFGSNLDIPGFSAGNFWWARADYINKLPDPMTLDTKCRWNAEGWIGLGNPKYKCYRDTRTETPNGERGWLVKGWTYNSIAAKQSIEPGLFA